MATLSCTSVGAQDASPALLDSPSLETRKTLEKALGSLLNSEPIKLSDEVFTQKNTVVIDQIKPPQTPPMLNGRELRAADSFSLLTQKGECMLRHNQTGKILLLDTIKCSRL